MSLSLHVCAMCIVHASVCVLIISLTPKVLLSDGGNKTDQIAGITSATNELETETKEKEEKCRMRKYFSLGKQLSHISRKIFSDIIYTILNTPFNANKLTI